MKHFSEASESNQNKSYFHEWTAIIDMQEQEIYDAPFVNTWGVH